MSHAVVIAGGGPTGLMLACELRLAGVETVVLERRAEPATRSQGMAVHGRTLELFQQRGLRDRIPAEETFVWPRTPFAMLWLNLDTVDERDYTVAFPQWRTEKLLTEHAVELGADLRRGHHVISADQDEAGVTVRVRSSDGEYELSGAYLVGCDGGQSAVREFAGIDVATSGAAYSGILGDVKLPETETEPFEAGVFPGGMFGALPLAPGMLRLMSIEFGTGPDPDAGPPTADDLFAGIKRTSGQDLHFDHVEWVSRFGGPTLLAQSYRKDRIFLAGDAAHYYFISGTQGMNAGIQDAVNLGWKLAAAVQGWAPPELLDTYHGERHPVGERMCVHADAVMALIHPLEVVAPLRELFGEILRFDSVNSHLLRIPTDADYPLGGPEAHPLVGSRIPNVALTTSDGPAATATALHAGQGVLFDLTGGNQDLGDLTPWKDRITVVTAAPTQELDTTTLLVRPDGYVVHAENATSDREALHAALTTWFGAAGSP